MSSKTGFDQLFISEAFFYRSANELGKLLLIFGWSRGVLEYFLKLLWRTGITKVGS
jgi:hypothetical protein